MAATPNKGFFKKVANFLSKTAKSASIKDFEIDEVLNPKRLEEFEKHFKDADEFETWFKGFQDTITDISTNPEYTVNKDTFGRYLNTYFNQTDAKGAITGFKENFNTRNIPLRTDNFFLPKAIKNREILSERAATRGKNTVNTEIQKKIQTDLKRKQIEISQQVLDEEKGVATGTLSSEYNARRYKIEEEARKAARESRDLDGINYNKYENHFTRQSSENRNNLQRSTGNGSKTDPTGTNQNGNAWSTSAKVAAGALVAGAGVTYALTRNRGQQSNAQLYGQQPLY